MHLVSCSPAVSDTDLSESASEQSGDEASLKSLSSSQSSWDQQTPLNCLDPQEFRAYTERSASDSRSSGKSSCHCSAVKPTDAVEPSRHGEVKLHRSPKGSGNHRVAYSMASPSTRFCAKSLTSTRGADRYRAALVAEAREQLIIARTKVSKLLRQEEEVDETVLVSDDERVAEAYSHAAKSASWRKRKCAGPCSYDW